jgi:hypothetical protein
VGPLSDRAFRLWISLLLEADDAGRMVLDVRHFRATAFGYQNISLGKVQAALDELLTPGLVKQYQVGGVKYLYFPSWHDHQRIDRPRPSAYPDPPKDSPNDRRTLVERSTTNRAISYPTDPKDRNDPTDPIDLPPDRPDRLSALKARTRIETGLGHVRDHVARELARMRAQAENDQGQDQDQDRARGRHVPAPVPSGSPDSTRDDLSAADADEPDDDPSVTGRPRRWGDLVKYGWGAGNVGAEAA